MALSSYSLPPATRTLAAIAAHAVKARESGTEPQEVCDARKSGDR